MPKKTRKEKIRAKERKHNFHPTSAEIKTENVVSEKEVHHTESAPTPSYTLSAEEASITHYFKNDLRKSLLIIGGIFALEIFFYFATMNNYLARYLKF